MPGSAPNPGQTDEPLFITGVGIGSCYQFSEFNQLGAVSFTRSGVTQTCTDPGVLSCGFFIDTTPGGTLDGPINGGARLDNYETYEADCSGGNMTFRYDNGIFNQLGLTTLFIRAWSRDACGTSYTTSLPIGPYNPITQTDAEIVTNTGLPTGTILFVTTHDDDTGGELPVGVYSITFSPIDDVSDQGLDLDNIGISYEVWTKPMRGGKLLAAGGGIGSRQVKTTDLIVDTELSDKFDKMKDNPDGNQVCLTRYLHVFNGGCNEDDIATYQVCIQPFKSDLSGEHLVFVRQSTNVELKGLNGGAPSYPIVIDEQDLRDDINQFGPATAYRDPAEPHGFWHWGGSISDSFRDGTPNQDDDEDQANDTFPGGPQGQDVTEDETAFVHWVNMHIETDPSQETKPSPQAQAIISYELLTNDITLHCDQA